MKYYTNMRITELAKLSGATVDELRYLETKGFLTSSRKQLKKRRVREYNKNDLRKIQLIVKYHRQGFNWNVSFQKSMWEMENPPLL